MSDVIEVAGASARSIAAHLLGLGAQEGCYPMDGSDFDRCDDLVQRHGLDARLPDMATVNAYWAELVPNWPVIRACDDPKKKTALIKRIVNPVVKLDPQAVSTGSLTIRTGPVSFSHDAFKTARAAATGKAPMKNTPEDKAVTHSAYDVTADELRSFVERYEHLEAEKKDITDQQKEVMAEAKGRGYDTKALRKLIALRKKKPDEIAEEEAVLDLYKAALGME